MSSKHTLKAVLAGAIALGTAGYASTSQAMDAPADKEKCYGVAKAGMNDCASADGAHNCAASATIDASGAEWIAMPKGLCARIVGASLEPVLTPVEASAESAPKAQ